MNEAFLPDKEPETLSSLFDASCVYSVPPYQRAYSWETQHVDQFLQDLSEHPAGKPYYLGHFLFERQSVDSLLLIDGQQRLSTVILFMGAAAQVLASRGEAMAADRISQRYVEREGRRRFQTVNADKDLFADLIRYGEAETGNKPRSQQRILAAWSKLLHHLEVLGTDDLLSLVEVIGGAHITHLVVRDKVQATQIFTLQNSRGKALTELEKFKAWLMYQVFLHSPKNQEGEAIETIERKFGLIYTAVETIKHLNEDQVLRHHNQAFSSRWSGPIENLQLDLKTVEGTAAVQLLTRYATALAASFQHVVRLEALLLQHEAIADLVILGPSEAWPLLIKLYSIHLDSLLRDPGLLELLDDTAITFLKFRFLSGKNKNYLPHDTKRLGTEPYTLDWLKTHMRETSMRGYNRPEEFQQAFRRFLDGNDHYRKESRFILWKYENALRPPGDDKISPGTYLNATAADHSGDGTLEHFSSRNPKGGPHIPEFQTRCLNNIGNLLFMKKGLNSSQGNKPVEVKGAVLENMSHASYREMAKMAVAPCEVASCPSGWCEHKIALRKEKIVAFATEKWRVE